jgi:hypothetical protein
MGDIFTGKQAAPSGWNPPLARPFFSSTERGRGTSTK